MLGYREILVVIPGLAPLRMIFKAKATTKKHKFTTVNKNQHKRICATLAKTGKEVIYQNEKTKKKEAA